VVTRQLTVERGTGKVRRSKIGVLPFYCATQPRKRHSEAERCSPLKVTVSSAIYESKKF